MHRKIAMFILLINIFGLLVFAKPSEGHPSFCTWHRHGHDRRHITSTTIPCHGGCLYVIESSDIGHVEVKQENDILKCWFTEKDKNINRPAGIPDTEIVFSIKTTVDEPRALILKSKHINAAEKSIVPYSYFEGQAEWLREIDTFEASGEVNIKGKIRKLQINYSTKHESCFPSTVFNTSLSFLPHP